MKSVHNQDKAGKHQAADSIQLWLIARLAELLNVAPESIDTREPFTSYGLGSLQAVTISGELEDWLGRKLAPTLVYDYPNVEVLARHLAEELKPADTSSCPAANGKLETDPIAIVGMSCRFPGARDPEEFWQRLRDGTDAITEVPAERWDLRAFYDPNPEMLGKMNTCWGGFLDRVDQFDPQFFGISPREAESIDPQQRLLLEASWEALERAGQAADKLAGGNCGVFIGISNSDYSRRCIDDFARINAYTGTGNAHSIAANRLSYVLDLRGPSVVIDTACSSSLVAVHMACQSLRNGECDLALAGGVNLVLSPELNIAFSQARMMSPGGRCKTFDADADGYVRGEGCGIVVLKRLSDALRDVNPILALLSGSAVNQDGRSNGLTAPNGPAQESVIRQALRNARVAPAEISYVETHGTGTPLGDPIEFQSLRAVLIQGRTEGQSCAIGSVKTNIGHTEAAAGIAGLIKVVLALQHEEIPPHLHLKKLNPHISLDDSPFLIPRQRRPWPRGTGRRVAGVSSFGFGGTNAHVILEETSPPKPALRDFERPLHIFTLSARSQSALKELALRYEKFLTGHPEASIADICFTTNAGRSHFEHRLALTVDSSAQLRERLASFTAGHETLGLHLGQMRNCDRPKVAFLFTGQGSQYSGMARTLYKTQPTFRKWLDHCDELLRPHLKLPLIEALYSPDGNATPLNETAYTQPALFAIEYALAQLWRSWGVVPAAVMGHSVGEYVAACVAEAYSLREGLRLISERGRLMQDLPRTGEMAAVFAAEETVASALSTYQGRVAIAASNGPASTVISGERDAVGAVLQHLESKGISARRLRVSHAFHSPLMDPILDEFEQTAQRVNFGALKTHLISNLTGRMLNPGQVLDAGYWRRHAREPVKFWAGLQTLAQENYHTFIEVGPAATLLALGKDCLLPDGSTWLPSLQKDQEDWRVLLDSVAALYVKGADLDWENFHRDYSCQRMPLPTYPFERERCWIESTEAGGVSDRRRVPRKAGNPERNPLLGLHTQLASPAGSHVWEIELDHQRFSYLIDHRVQDIAVAPVALYIELARAAAAEVFGRGPLTLSRLEFKKALFLPDEGSQKVQMVFSPEANGEMNFACYSYSDGEPRQWMLHATGTIRRSPGPSSPTSRTANLVEQKSGGREQDMRFGLIFFSSSEAAVDSDKYHLLFESTKFADRAGFSSVWIPERHFTKDGWLYPNPAVLQAALARETRRIRLLAGSVVMPLHDPIRVAEEWAMVDNLSGGRVGLSFASGWHPNDFVFFPERYENRHEEMFRGIDIVRKLWRGESITLKNGVNKSVKIGIYPTPIQSRLPVWITAAGNPQTFEKAGEIGANVLTHMFNQSVDELAQKIKVYRDSLAEHGFDPDAGEVSLMLHTYVDDHFDSTHARIEGAFCQYLKSASYLLDAIGSHRGKRVDLTTLSEKDIDDYVRFVFDRLLSERRVLFGTPETCLATIARLHAIGVNEIACQLDFGMEIDLVLKSLPHLNRLRELCQTINTPVSHSVLHAGNGVANDVEPARVPSPPGATGLEAAAGTHQQDRLEDIRARCVEEVPADEFYRRLDDWGIQFGPALRGIERLWRGGGEALGSVRLTSTTEAESHLYQFHPGFLDACFQVLMATLPSEILSKTKKSLYLPVGLRSVRIHRRPGTRVWSHARLRADARGSEDEFEGDVRLLDEEGTALFEAFGMRLQRAEAGASMREGRSDPAGLFYELQWQPKVLSAIASADPSTWVIFCDSRGVSDTLTKRLEAQGDKCIFVSAGDVYERLDETHFRVYPERPEDVSRLFEAIGGGRRGCRGIVHLWSLDLTSEEATPDTGKMRQALGCGSALSVIQVLVRLDWPQLPRLWLVTQGAQPVGEMNHALAVNQSPIWGLGRTCSIEHPEIWGGLVDIDPEGTVDDAAAQLQKILHQEEDEDQIALRKGGPLVARLVHSPAPVQSNVALRPDGSYLVTGGLDGVGFEVARWMVAKGARHLILLGRRKLPPRKSWNRLDKADPLAERIVKLKELEKEGAKVEYFSVDVADAVGLDKFFAKLNSSARPPIRGVMHAASVWENEQGRSLVRALLHLEASDFAQVFRPKVTGSWLLQRHLSRVGYDFMVFFSSAASICGSAGQGNYAAASAFLDALAHRLRAAGKPALSINWGAISGAGFGASPEGLKVHEFWESQGIKRISVSQVLDILDRVLFEGRSQIGVMKIDWTALKGAFPQIARMPWARDLFQQPSGNGTEGTDANGGGEFKRTLLSIQGPERHSLIQKYLCDAISGALRLPVSKLEVDQPIIRLGLDSLIALELRNRIQVDMGVRVPIVKLLHGPSITDFATYLGEIFEAEQSKPGSSFFSEEGHTADTDESVNVREQVDKMSDQEVDLLLNRLMTSKPGDE